LSPGEHLRLSGRWTSHPKHGLQFQVEHCEQTLPATVAGMRRYLGSGLIKGIGPRLAERIVAQFGARTLEVIENHPERLREVPDIGAQRARLIAEAWEEQKQVKEIMLFLHGYMASAPTWPSRSISSMGSRPWRWSRATPTAWHAISLEWASRLPIRSPALLGLPADHPSRIEAGVVYILREMLDAGHVYAPAPELVVRAAKLLELPEREVPPAIERLSSDGARAAGYLPLERRL
jgi:exodeoxyribonuclease V alpha subunit